MEDQPRSPDDPADRDRPDTPTDRSGAADEGGPADQDATADQGSAADPDATAGFDAAAAAAEPSDDRDDDVAATQIGPPLDLDATRESPGISPTSGAPVTPAGPSPDPDQTRTFDPDVTRYVPTVNDATSVLPPTGPDQTAVGPTVPEGWQGRATVRPGGPPPAPPDGDQPGPPGGGRAWWLPILLGVIGLLLIVGLAYGLVVATQHKNTTPTPSPTPTTVPSTVAPSTTPPSTPPSTPPPTTASVTVPGGLTTLDLNGAEDALTQSGLKFTTVPQTTTDPSQVGRVLSTDPASGTQVAPGSTVTLTYGVAPSAPPSPSPSTAGAEPSPGSS